jgi:hypothetical protein
LRNAACPARWSNGASAQDGIYPSLPNLFIDIVRRADWRAGKQRQPKCLI